MLRALHKNRTNAYLTVYLTLTLTVLLSLCLVLIEGVRKNYFFMEAECVTDIGLNSIFAEYHRELLRQYNLFAIDSSYGSALPQVNLTGRHLENYIQKNLSTKDIFLDWALYRDFLQMKPEKAVLTKALLYTDNGGSVFRRRAAEAVWDDMDLDLYQELNSWLRTVESEKMTTRDIAAEKSKLDKKLKSYDGKEVQISETEWIKIEVKNPTAALEKKRKEGILKWVIKDQNSISKKSLNTSNLIMARMSAGSVNKGNMPLENLSNEKKALEKFFFQEYLLRYMGYYGEVSEENALSYQIEYLLTGKDSDLENLKGVVNTLFAIREVANVSYIMGDQEKCAVAEALGGLLASAMTIPEASSLIKMILLFGWAFAESIHDVKCLLAGGRVPLMKNKDTWFYDLEKALKLGDADEDKDKGKSGLFYRDYLRILMMLEKEDLLTARAMNMVEADIRQTPGNESFRLDGCLDAVEANVEMKSAFGYTCDITRQKSYSMH